MMCVRCGAPSTTWADYPEHTIAECIEYTRQQERESVQAEFDALKAEVERLRRVLSLHVCVKAIQGDGMDKIDYLSVDRDDCLLCAALAQKEKKP